MSKTKRYLDINNPENIRLERRPAWATLMQLALSSWVDKQPILKIFELPALPHYFGWYADSENPSATISLADTTEESVFKKEVIKKLTGDQFYFERVEKNFLSAIERLNNFLFYVFDKTRSQKELSRNIIIEILKNLRPIYLQECTAYDFPYYYGEFVSEYLNEKLDERQKEVVFAQPTSILVFQEISLINEIKNTKNKDFKSFSFIEKLENYLKLFGFTKEGLNIHSTPEEIYQFIKKSPIPKTETPASGIKIPSQYYPWTLWMRKLLEYRNTEAQNSFRVDFLMNHVWQKAAEILGTDYSSLLTYIGFDEILTALEKSQKLGKLVSERKKKGVSIAFKNEHVQIYTGIDKEDQSLINKVLQYQNKPAENSKLKGMVAYKGGIVKGKALVVFSPKDIKIPNDDFILVSPNTDPNFVPLMKKAKGIVTNEGGILSHAAIMSREFQIACVVGTQKATDVIKTGQEICLDCEKGEVTILD